MIWPESANELNASDPPLLADLVDEIAERLQRDEDVDITLYISRHPGLEPELRAAYESLVGVRHFLQQGDAAAADAEPKQLGDYRLLHEIGRGGMGVVYEA